ncbi:uncharacterized protein LOC135521258 isoform X1 [Oncorhynchus masou masou]|uniref:uncharacterized protein LOC135521258 isoform X1 n=1 Tax=Oncorhynchus masou masou TaxID=90313 RepID=UPI0031837D06
MSSFEGLQSMGVLCFHCPIYISLLWACGQSILGPLWGWHSWQGLPQGYCVTVVAWLYWTRYVPSLLTKPTKEPQKKTGASLEKLMAYMKPYIIRFGVMLSLVVISSLGDLVSRITTDTNDMSESLSEKLSLLMWYFMRVTFHFIFMLNLSWKLSLFTAMGLPIIWVIPKIPGKWFQVQEIRPFLTYCCGSSLVPELFVPFEQAEHRLPAQRRGGAKQLKQRL